MINRRALDTRSKDLEKEFLSLRKKLRDKESPRKMLKDF
jgi:hypothetical protein